MSSLPSPIRSAWLPRRALGVVLVRGRFILLVGALLALIATWPYLQNQWDKLTRSPQSAGAISGQTEYWCPMCPGVVSDWPSKCPVCSMTLVRRDKSDMTPLPDGVLARIQLSPYRLQLAGIRTAPVEFRRLEYEITAGGFLESDASASAPLLLNAEVFEHDALHLSVGQECELACDMLMGEAITARLVEIAPPASSPASRRIRLRLDRPRAELRPGSYASAKFRVPLARLETHREVEVHRWRDRVAMGTSFVSLGRLDGLTPPGGPLFALLEAGVRQAAAREGFVLAVTESAVIDTGRRKVVYQETMPGMFDAIEVELGRRCGDFYPVRGGLELGQRVAAAGAVLLDAETRLNPSVAATYFGSGPRAASTPSSPSSSASPEADDRVLIARQKICPVTGGDLDAMGGPVKLVVDGRVVFICCEGCEKPLRQKPMLYLPKLPK